MSNYEICASNDAHLFSPVIILNVYVYGWCSNFKYCSSGTDTVVSLIEGVSVVRLANKYIRHSVTLYRLVNERKYSVFELKKYRNGLIQVLISH